MAASQVPITAGRCFSFLYSILFSSLSFVILLFFHSESNAEKHPASHAPSSCSLLSLASAACALFSPRNLLVAEPGACKFLGGPLFSQSHPLHCGPSSFLRCVWDPFYWLSFCFAGCCLGHPLVGFSFCDLLLSVWRS